MDVVDVHVLLIYENYNTIILQMFEFELYYNNYYCDKLTSMKLIINNVYCVIL